MIETPALEKKSTAANVADAYPASPVQQGLLFHSLYEQGSGVYVTQMVCSLSGLRPELFEEAWQRVIERHDVLRTAFVWMSVEKPLQVVGRRVRALIKQMDQRGVSAAEREAGFKTYLTEDRQLGFDVAKAPLMRLALWREDDDLYKFVWSHHHLLLDGWAAAIVLKEVFLAYDALSRGVEPGIGSVWPYKNYIAWLQQQDLHAAEAYWRETLAGFRAPTTFNVDRVRRSGTDGYGTRTLRLDHSATANLHALGRSSQLTLNTLVQGAWAVMLSRYSGQKDVCFGAVVAGRPAELTGADEMVGLFINTLPVRTQLMGAATVTDWLRGLQVQQFRARNFEYSPLSDVQRWSEIDAGQQLFDNYIVFENYPIDETLKGRIKGLTIHDVESLEQSSYPMVLAVMPGERLTLHIHHDRGRFDDALVDRLLGHLAMLLEAFVASPEQRLNQLPSLTTGEQQQLLREFNQGRDAEGTAACIHDLFERQVAQTPNAVAVVDDKERVTYAELDARANQLARHLRTLGVGQEVRVGLCVKRSAAMVQGLLGILKAGGVYLPLDSSYPQDRLEFMIDDAGAEVLVTDSAINELLPLTKRSLRVVYLDAAEVASQSAEQLAVPVSPANLAYVIYTSGSTGKPKGVAITHEAAAGHLRAIKEVFGLTGEDRFLQFASQSFDVSVEQMLGPLLTGASIVLRGDEVWSTRDFLKCLHEERLTVANFPPAFWQQITQDLLVDDELSELGELRLVIVGGDLLSAEAARRWLSTHLSHARLLNAYGPTEATITATTFDVTKQAVAEANEALPIGRAVGARVLYVLDREGHPVPLGVFGELHIGGPLLARGYLNHAALTAAAFVPDPFSGEHGARLYRTGDVARWLADGTIEFVGRADRQVKIRGFRVELGEIEAALRRHPSVNEAVVLALDDSITKGKQIVAYLVTNKDSEHEQWREFLKEWLPDHMIPGAFISIEQLPLTPNGKVDRIALAALEVLKPSASDNGSAAAITETERVIADVWAEILEVEQVGPTDNFFELGGHSLLATQIISRLRKKFKVELPFRIIFEEQTVRAIGRKIEKSLAEKSQSTPQTSAPEVTEPLSSFKRAPRNGLLPLSFAQERLWFLEQLDPGLPLYNVPAFVKLSGSLNVAAFNKALNELVRRHEILRTSFVSVGDGASQQISTTLELPLPLTDLSSLPTDERWSQALDLAAAEVRQPFDLAQAPLLRTQLLRLEENEHVLLLTMHHIVSDGWSLGRLVREMAALYEAYCEGRYSQLGSLPIQYADYAVWQREEFAGEKVEAPLNYWREQLRGASVLELPTDHPRPARQSFSGKSHRFSVPRSLADSLAELSQRQGATLFMTLLTAFQVLLSRYSGQSDVSVGTPVAGRTHTETEALIGLFVNTLVIRAHIDANESFLQVLDQIRKASLEAQTRQELPFERIVDALQPKRALNRHPLFDVMFVMQNPLLPVLQLPGLRLSPLPVETNSAKFDLTLEIEPADDSLHANLEYSTDLFEPDTIHRLAGSYLRLLEAITADPSRRVASLPLLGEAERQRLVCELNDTAHEWPWATLPEMFREQVRSTPEAAAIEDKNGERLTYAELDHESEQLAHRLRQVTVGPESIVAVLMDRSLAMVVALLGVLKSGAAYLPLDPANPPERLRFMLDDSQARVILTKQNFLDLLPGHEALVICVDAQHERLESDDRPPEISPEISPQNLAYVIYTSGSTGTPKGVMVTHHGLANYLRWSSAAYESQAGAGAVVHSPIGFDLTVTSLWIPLLSGTRVLLVGEGMGVIEELAGSLDRDEEFTLLKLTPAHLEPLAAELAKRSAAAGVRRLVIGGEALHAEQLSWWREHAPETQVVNEYGPTETVVGCCVYERAASELVAGAVPIGRPIANTRLYVLDAGLELVPEGVSGELHVGGAGVSRGYLNRAGLTAERFVPDAFSNIPGARLYKTGDVVRWTQAHQLEYTGRADGQIKLRGYRVETGEVEVVLRRHSQVRNAVVVVRDNANAKQLISYLVAEDGAELTAGELREYLRSRLPEYMIPERFLTLDELPLTVNGKVDRLALSQLDGKDLAAVETYAPPLTVTEEIVAGIWREVLQVESVGVNENFFEKGGHSLLATRVVLRLQEAFDQQEFTLQNFFEGPTVAQVAAQLEALERNGEGKQTSHIGRYDRTEEAPLSFAQERLWFIEHLQPGSALYHIKLRTSFKGYLNVAALETALNEIVRRHEVLRTSFRDLGNGQARQHISPMLSLPLPVTDLTRLPIDERAETAQRLAREEEHQPFDLTRAPLLRTRLFRFAEDDYLLVLTIHHIAADGWSMGVLVREVSELYRAYSEGHESPLEELPMQYADYAAWQREQMAYLFMDEQLIYWRDQLSGARPLELPTDRPRPAVLSRRGAEEPVELTEELSRELKKLADREGVTLFIVMLAAFQILLAQRAGHHDVSVGTDIANRNRLETENLIGFFVNQLVLRTDLSGNPSFREVLKRVRAVTLGAYAHQDLPFDRLVDALKVKRSLQLTPLFQVKLIFQNTPLPPIELPDLVVSVLNNPMEFAREDLTLSLREEAGVIKGWFEYDTDLFNPATIVQLRASYLSLLQDLVSQPDVTFDEVTRAIAEAHLHDRIARERETKKVLSQKVKTIRRKSINLSDEGLVTVEPQNGDGPLPLIMRPAMKGVNLARWAEKNRAVIENRLLHHGALLFQGFDLGTATEFRNFVKAISGDPLEYQERSSPRTGVGDQIYTSTDYPEDQSIFPHNEHSYSQTFPLKLFFFCETPALSGGQTPLADTRKIFARLSPRLRERFSEKKWLLVRNYGDGIGLPWQTVFQTSDRAAVEDYCRRAGISVEWKPDGGLRTRQVRPAIIKHPRSGEVAWFNHATFFHVTTLEPSMRDALLDDFREEDLPTNSYYGDGSPIEASVLEELREAYREEMVTFSWEAGSVVLLDNILTSHARTAFNGPRRILFAMAEPFTRTDL